MEQNTEKIKLSFFRETKGKMLLAAILLITLLVLMFFSWSVQLELPPFSQILFPKAGEGDGMLRKILMQIRLPRIILGALTGASLAVSGAILQGVMRNPLARRISSDAGEKKPKGYAIARRGVGIPCSSRLSAKSAISASSAARYATSVSPGRGRIPSRPLNPSEAS